MTTHSFRYLCGGNNKVSWLQVLLSLSPWWQFRTGVLNGDNYALKVVSQSIKSSPSCCTIYLLAGRGTVSVGWITMCRGLEAVQVHMTDYIQRVNLWRQNQSREELMFFYSIQYLSHTNCESLFAKTTAKLNHRVTILQILWVSGDNFIPTALDVRV